MRYCFAFNFLMIAIIYSGILNSSVPNAKVTLISSLFFFLFCCSVTKLCLTLFNPMDCSMPGSSVLHYLPEFAQILIHWVSDAINYLIFCHPLLLFPSIFPIIRVLFPMNWLFKSSDQSIETLASVLPVNIQGWFRIYWFDLLAIQGTLESSPAP